MKATVHLVEGFLKTGPGFPVDLPDRLFQRGQGFLEISVLRIKVLLALLLLLELLDGGQVDRAEAIDAAIEGSSCSSTAPRFSTRA